MYSVVTMAGVCGDWLLGSGVAAALASGAALGRQIAEKSGVSVGVAAPFSPVLHNNLGLSNIL